MKKYIDLTDDKIPVFEQTGICPVCGGRMLLNRVLRIWRKIGTNNKEFEYVDDYLRCVNCSKIFTSVDNYSLSVEQIEMRITPDGKEICEAEINDQTKG